MLTSRSLSQQLLLLGQQVLAAQTQQLAHLRHELEEAWVPHASRPCAGGQVDLDDAGDPAGARAHHDDARREEDRLGDRVRDEDDRRGELLPDREQLQVQALARHLVERAERLVHQEQRRLERERARDRDALLHAAGELPGVVVAEPLQLDELEHLVDARLAASRGPSRASRAAARCSCDTVRQSNRTASWKTIP